MITHTAGALVVTARTASTRTDDVTSPPSSAALKDGVATNIQATTASTPPASDTGARTLTIGSGINESWTVPQTEQSFSNDDHLTKEEGQHLVAPVHEEIAGRTYEEITGRGEPIPTFFALTCTNS